MQWPSRSTAARLDRLKTTHRLGFLNLEGLEEHEAKFDEFSDGSDGCGIEADRALEGETLQPA